MGKFDNFSTKAVYAASLITSILCMGLWFLTTNVIVLICSMVIVPFCVTRIFHRQVTGRGKVFVTLILILLCVACMLWFRNKPQVDNTPTDTPGISDTTPADNTNNDENNDDNPVIDDQKVNTGSTAPGKFYGYGKAKPKADEVLTPDYSNTGGSSKNGQTVNNGKVTTDGADSIKIEVPSSDPEGDKALQKDKDAGKDIHKTDSGITWTADNTPDDKKDEVRKDESTRKDVSNENAVKIESSKESDTKPTIPEPKQDATKTDDKKLDDLYNNTSNTQSGPVDNKGDKKPVADEAKDTTSSKVDKPTTTEEKKPQSGAEQTTTNTQKGEQQGAKNNDSDKKTETKPEVETTPVTIVSLDGGKAYAGDSVQFRITGEVKSIEGLDGYVKGVDYTFTNGCLTINTHPKVATSITVEVVGTNGTTATSTVAISVI